MSDVRETALPGTEARIVNNVEANQFEWGDGAEPAILTYRIHGNVIVYRHTVVPPSLRKRGIATKLAAHALSYARENGLMVVPLCPHVLSYLERHPEYGDLVVPRARWTEILDGN
jgi:predicted GNAT family acetyltransferase